MNRWQDDAACKGLTDLMYPTRGDYEGLQVALSICESCTVKPQCLEYVVELGEPEGIWAGTTGRQRRAMKVEQARECGTLAAYRAGCRCGICIDARRAYDRDTYRRRTA